MSPWVDKEVPDSYNYGKHSYYIQNSLSRQTIESQTGSWRTASSRLKGTFQERGGLISRQFIRYHLMRLKLGEDLHYLITGKDTKRAIASSGEVLALRPELASAD